MERLDIIIDNLMLFLGSISIDLTEEDFNEMEKMGMHPNRGLIESSINRYKHK